MAGALITAPASIAPERLAVAVRPAALHMVTVGWLTQLVFGVALWMFPRHSREQPHGPQGLGWFVYASLNAGLALRAVSEPAAVLGDTAGWGYALAASAWLQWLAVVAFAVLLWPRVRVR